MSDFNKLKAEDPGQGNIRLFHSTFSDGRYVTAINISKLTENDPTKLVATALSLADIIKLPSIESGYTLNVTSRQEYNTHYYIEIDPIKIYQTASIDDTDVNLLPFIESADSYDINFNPTDYLPLYNNVSSSRTTFKFYEVERDRNSQNPENLYQLLGHPYTTLGDILFENSNSNKIKLNQEDIFYGATQNAYSITQTFYVQQEGLLKITKAELGKLFNNLKLSYSNFKGDKFKSDNKIFLQVSTDINFTSTIINQVIINQKANGNFNKVSTASTLTQVSKIVGAGTYYLRLLQQFHFEGIPENINSLTLTSATTDLRKGRNLTNISISIDPLEYIKPYAKYSETQEYNYTSLGWINARYEGSTTSADQYGDIFPSIGGKTIAGEIYGDNADNAYIASQSYSDRILNTVLYQGDHQENSPQLLVQEIGTLALALGNIVGAAGNEAGLSLVLVTLTKDIEIDAYDVLYIDGEYLQVQPPALTEFSDSKYTLAAGEQFAAETQRGHADSLVGVLDASKAVGTKVLHLKGDYIYTLDNNVPRKTIDSKIWLDGINSIVTTDSKGRVISSSQVDLNSYYIEPSPTPSLTPSATPQASPIPGASPTPSITPSITPIASVTGWKTDDITNLSIVADQLRDYNAGTITGTITVAFGGASISPKLTISTGFEGTVTLTINTNLATSTVNRNGVGTQYGPSISLSSGTYSFELEVEADAGNDYFSTTTVVNGSIESTP